MHLFTEHWLVAAVHGSLVKGDGDDWLTHGGEEEEETPGNRVGGAWQLSDSAHI